MVMGVVTTITLHYITLLAYPIPAMIGPHEEWWVWSSQAAARWRRLGVVSQSGNGAHESAET